MTESRRAVRSAQDVSPSSHPTLDPRTLGRPVHLLPAFAAQMREDLAEFFHVNLNRRYQAEFQVGEICIDAAGTAPAGRWQGFATEQGQIGCALDRILVLSTLVYRYGLIGDEATPESAPETATEERLAAMLGRQLAGILTARIEAGLNAVEKVSGMPESTALGAVGTPRSSCLITVTIHETRHRIEGQLHLTLDDAWMAVLLRRLTPPQRKRSGAESHALPLPARLNFKLVARLLEKDLTLGELLDLRIGTVIPVSLRSTDVLIGDSRLMTATVAEHKGKLCLTSFNDVN
jgi:flagellar motor switch protein FliM